MSTATLSENSKENTVAKIQRSNSNILGPLVIIGGNWVQKAPSGRREGRISSLKKLEDFHLNILVSHAIVRFAKVEQCILPGRPQLLSRLRKAFLFRSQTSAQLSQVSLEGLHLLRMSRLCGLQKFRVLSQTLDGLVSDLEKLRLENTTKGE
nr:hypothetical protein Iba_chr01aCG2570 [Ipomoea batatas]